MAKEDRASETIKELQAKFYSSGSFLGFYTNDFRLEQFKKALADKRTSAGERLQYLKYLDAHKGDVPATGPDSGKVVVETYSVADLRRAMAEDKEQDG